MQGDEDVREEAEADADPVPVARSTGSVASIQLPWLHYSFCGFSTASVASVRCMWLVIDFRCLLRKFLSWHAGIYGFVAHAELPRPEALKAREQEGFRAQVLHGRRGYAAGEGMW